MSYQLRQNKLLQSLATLNNMLYVISHSFWELGTWDCFSCWSLAQDISHDWAQGWVMLQVCLELEDLFQRWPLAESPVSLPNGSFHKGCLSILMTWFPQSEWLRMRANKKSQSKITHRTATVFYSLEWATKFSPHSGRGELGPLSAKHMWTFKTTNHSG